MNWQRGKYESIGEFTSTSTSVPHIIFNDGTTKAPSDDLIALSIPIGLVMSFSSFSFAPVLLYYCYYFIVF